MAGAQHAQGRLATIRPMEVVRLGEGEPLVLVHFQGGHARSWQALFEPLAREHEVHAVALPGFGASPPLSEPATMAALARAVREAVPHDTFHVAGCSLGGGVALELGRQGAARSVCAVSPAGFAEGWEMAWLHSYLRSVRLLAPALTGQTWRRPGLRRAVLVSMTPHGERWRADEVRALLASCAEAPGYPLTARHALRERFEPYAPTCPVVVAWGDRDHLLLHGPQSARARRALPHAHHVTLRGCGHLPFRDDPQAVAAAVLRATHTPNVAPARS